MRVAVVDIGTNTTRLLIAGVEHGHVTDELERISKVTRLGAGVDADGRLHEDAMERVYRVLDEYRELIEDRHAEKRLAVLTSAARDAANGEQFAESVQKRYGLEAHLLTGDSEAQLTFLGANSDRDPDDPTPTLVIDIGGGSTEFVIGARREVRFHVSTQAGVVRQGERHIKHDPPAESELEALAQDVRSIIAEAVPEEHREAVGHAIAVAGTATSLAAIAQQLDPYDPKRVHGYVLRAEERERLQQYLAALTVEQRREVTGLDPARAPTIVPGVVILGEVMALFGLDEVEVSEHDILRGAAIAL